MRFCAFDVETTGRVPQFHSGALWSDETQFYTESHREFLDAMRHHARKRYVFAAHNAEYDASVTLWNAGEDLTMHYLNDRYDCGYWHYGSVRRNAQIWDTVKLTAGMRLADLGEAMGLPKYTTPKALLGEDDWRPSWVCEHHSQRECIECYNLRDAEIVWCYCNMMQEWLDGIGCKLHKSLPATAVDIWRTWDEGKQQTIRSRPVRELAQAAFHGGRCEVFKYGHVVPVQLFDVRSMHGAILRDCEFADCSTLRYDDRDLQWDNLQGAHGIVEATVFIEHQHVPPLPAKHDGKLYFPVGTVKGAWSIAELENALAYGTNIVKLHQAVWTHQAVRPFEITARALLDLREDAIARDDPRQIVYKFLINAIPGRLGMREAQTRRMYRRWKPGLTVDELRGYDLESSADAVYLAREIGHIAQSRTSNILWAASITAEARVRLYRHLMEAGHSLVYCDTDSVHSQTKLPTFGNIPGNLVDKGYYESGLYLGPKLYRIESSVEGVEVRAKGVPRAKADEYIHTGQVQFNTTLSVREAIARGEQAGTWIDVTRTLGHGLGSRTIRDPSVLADHDGYSPTLPVVFCPEPCGDNALTNWE